MEELRVVLLVCQVLIFMVSAESLVDPFDFAFTDQPVVSSFISACVAARTWI
jgi:hypothetical protein